MKTWMITFPFLFAAGLANAADPAPAPKAEAAPAAEQPASAKPAMAKRYKARHLPKGDLRHCLDLKDSRAIIRCSETRRL